MTDQTLQIIEPEVTRLIDPDVTLERVADGFEFTEGPVWDYEQDELIFSDIPGDTMYRYTRTDGVSVYRSPSNFSNGMTIDQRGQLIVCEHRTRRVVVGGRRGFETFVDNYGGTRLNAPNDVIVAKDGSVIFTDPHYGLGEGFGGPADQELSHRGVYRVPPGSREPELLARDFDGPNGLALTPDEQNLLVIDSEHGHIRSFSVGESWTLEGGDVLVTIDGDGDGVLDGMKLDHEGTIYSTGPGGIWISSPAGSILGRIRVPEVAANLAWGDADGSTLYITASTGLYRVPTRTTGYVPHRTATDRTLR